MKASVWVAPFKFETRDLPEPEPRQGEALIRVAACGICGSDIGLSQGGRISRGIEVKPPLVIGHEICGEIVRIQGKQSLLREGQRVSVQSYSSCGRCSYCRTGNNFYCKSGEQLGYTRNGGFEEFVSAPLQNLYPLPDHLTFEEASLVDTLSGPVYASQRANLEIGSTIAIVGGGPAGLCFVQVARNAGATCIALVSRSEHKLNCGKRLGADLTINANEEEPVEVVRDMTEGDGVDVAIEAAYGSAETISQALSMVRPGGKAILYGVPTAPASPAAFNLIVKKNIAVFGICGQEYQTSIRLLSTARVDAKPLITHKFGLDEVGNAIEMVRARSGNIIKAIVLPCR